MAWHYFRDGITQGPVDLSELQRLHQTGVVEPTTPVWSEGMADWTPYQETSAATSNLASTGTIATHACAECGRSFPEDEMLHYEGAWVCATCKPLFFQRIKEGVASPGKLVYASVGRRWLAVLIDGILLYVVNMLPLIALGGAAALAPRGRAALPPALNISLSLLGFVVGILYEVILIGKFGATLGKMAMKVKVVTPEGGRVSYARATGRYFAKILSSLILGIGYLMALWDDEKRTLHDRLCKTRVVSTEP